MKKRIIALALCLGTMMLMVGCGKEEAKETKVETTTETVVDTQAKEGSNDVELNKALINVEISVKDKGIITLELYPDVAPITVQNFVNLVDSGFYDNLTFHRIISGFMIQGGDPLGNGMGGSEETIVGEFKANNIENNLSHERGVISMARSVDLNSASSQFFIMHQDNPGLDGQYAAFGKVTSGIEIVDQICGETMVEDSNGTVSAENQPVIEYIKIIDAK